MFPFIVDPFSEHQTTYRAAFLGSVSIPLKLIINCDCLSISGTPRVLLVWLSAVMAQSWLLQPPTCMKMTKLKTFLRTIFIFGMLVIKKLNQNKLHYRGISSGHQVERDL